MIDTETAVLELARGRTPAQVAEQVGATTESVDALARHFGWPARTVRLKAAARSIEAGHGETALLGTPDLVPAEAPEPEGQPQPAAEATAPEFVADPWLTAPEAMAEATAPGALHVHVAVGTTTPEDIAAAVSEALAPAPTVQEDDVPAPDPALAEADRILQILDAATGPTATLSTSLDVMLTATGTPVALTEAVVGVSLDLDALQRALGGEDVSPVVVGRCESRLTDAGRELVRRLAAMDAGA